MELKTIGKRLATEPIKASLVQGENGVNRMEIRTPRYLDGSDLSGYIFKIRGTDAQSALVEQVLEKKAEDSEIILLWEISLRFTAVAGPLTLELDAISPDGAKLVKFSAAEIIIGETLGMPPLPAEDIFEKALNDISVLQETKLSAENILAGENITVQRDGKDVTISSAGGAAVIDDENISGESVYSSAKLEKDFAGRNAIDGAVQEAVDRLEFPVASESELGCIKVGRNLAIDGDGVLSAMASGGGGTEIDDTAASLVTVYSSSKVETDFARKTAVDEAVSQKAEKVHSHSEYLTAESISGLGNGDMKKSVYDKTGNGIVDNAEKVNGLTVLTAVPANAKFTDTTYGVVSTTANGLCPKRNGSTTYFLRGDGAWGIPPNTTYGSATTSASGLMTSAMVTKLNGIATGANKYALPTASSSTLGGIKVGSGLAISGGVLSVSNPGETKELLFSGKLLSGGTYDFSKSITSFKKVLVTAEYADSGTTRISQKTLYVDQCPINASTVTDIAVTAGTANICFPEAAKFSITVGGSTSYTFKIYGVK